MKIGIDARGAIWHRGTGLGTYSYELIRHLRYFIPDLKLYWPGAEYYDLQPQQEKKFQLIERYREEYWQKVFIPEQLPKDKIQLYHVPQNGIGLPQAKVCKYVVTIHDLIPYVYPETTGKGYLKKFLQEMPYIVENADHIITVSNWSKEDILRIFNVPKEKISVIYEAAEPHFQPLDPTTTKTYLKKKYHLVSPYLLYIGGFSPRKNIAALINAFAKLAPDFPDLCLCLPGKREKEQETSNILVEALGLSKRVKFLGFVQNEELPYLYSGAEAFVYPSIYEGFGLPPLEAMACGTPVISAASTCLPEAIGEGGLFFNPYDPLDIAEKISAVLLDKALQQKLRAKGLAHVKNFSWHKTAKETFNLYRYLLAQ